jgi:hypothetical protein
MTTAYTDNLDLACRLAKEADQGGFSPAAREFASETGSDVVDDVAAILLGKLNPETFMELCLDGADDDRVAGARAYTAGIVGCVARIIASGKV